MFGRVLKASIAKDNGRSAEFIRRRVRICKHIVFLCYICIFQDYPNKTQCYECGERGHLSYKCSTNLLGERNPPKKVKKKKKKDVKEEKVAHLK